MDNAGLAQTALAARPSPWDLGLAVALAVLGQLDEWLNDLSLDRLVTVPGFLVMTLAVAWRRRAPWP
jgi:hypothetical protein